MYSHYKVLPVAPLIFKILAWTGIGLGTISALVVFSGAGLPETPRWMGVVTLFVGALYFFFFSVASEGIKLLLEIKDRIK